MVGLVDKITFLNENIFAVPQIHTLKLCEKPDVELSGSKLREQAVWSSGESPVQSAWSKFKCSLLETAKEVCGPFSAYAW